MDPIKIAVFKNDSIQGVVADAHRIAQKMGRDVTFELWGKTITISPHADLNEVIETLTRMQSEFRQAKERK